ncbi:DUF1998 domain-containing protein [Pelagibacteraceae bacterium]|nr:DUF1998 domain-containing protein [Pelagibacteraceae bacterium]
MIKDKPKKKWRKKKPTKRTIRRGDLVSVNGVGSIYSFKDHYSKSGNQDSLMLAGLNQWQAGMIEEVIPNEWRIDEPRLKSVLDKDYFVLPPDYRESSENEALNRRHLPYYRFPNWHYCPICGKMKKLGVTSEGNQKCITNHQIEKNVIPVRFIVICKSGHIDDFPFFDWVHQKKNKDIIDKNIKEEKLQEVCNEKHLIYKAGKGGNSSILSVRIECSNCKSSETLASAFQKDGKNPFEKLNNNSRSCTGRRPWLGSESKVDQCKDNPEVVLRNAIKVYYPVIKSSLYIPVDTKAERNTYEFLTNINYWNKIEKKLEDKQKLKAWLEGFLDDSKFSHLKFENVFNAILEKEKNQNKLNLETIKDNEEAYKHQEYKYIKNPETIENSYLELSIKKRSINDYSELKKYFSSIFLVDRLTETRVQRGFTRSKPFEEGGDSKIIQELTINKSIRWLPATVVKGEGIFFEFNLDSINEWEKKFNFKYINEIKKKYTELRKIRGLSEEKNIRNKYFLIHTFAHLLINQLSYSCGYGSSSLRERVYCNENSNENEMQGVLIYTASGDSEGSLGGLVREGEPQNIIKIIKKMLYKANVCSYDPVCLDHKQQGLNGTNASACHACSFLSETSCEQSNQLLDRTTIIGDIKYKSKGYFEDLILN